MDDEREREDGEKGITLLRENRSLDVIYKKTKGTVFSLFD